MHARALEIIPGPGVVQIRGARQNNLKGIDLDLPLGKLNVICGPSGSGKSSLAFDTIYAEGQRRYVETFSPYTRQFLDRMDKPQVDEIRGIPPAIAIEQANNIKSSRSTVGTMTEINDYLKNLMPRIARAFCPSCKREVRPETAQSIAREVLDELGRGAEPTDLASAVEGSPEGNKAATLVTFGVPVPPKTAPKAFFAFLKEQGYVRVWIGGEIHRTDVEPAMKRLPGLVHVIQDRIVLAPENQSRLVEAIETAVRFGKGRVAFIDPTSKTTHPFSTGWHCAHCDIDLTPPTPGLFSFNNPLGACPRCRGFGRTITIELDRAIPDRNLSIAKGAVRPFQTENGRECQRDLLRHAALNEVDVHRPFSKLPESDQRFVLEGERKSDGTTSTDLWENGRWYGVRGFFDWLESKTYKMHVRVLLSRYRSYTKCPDCNGGRFQPAALNFRVGKKSLPELCAMPVSSLAPLLQNANCGADPTARMLQSEIVTRLNYLADVGVGYLSLDRQARTLSGGEIQRVSLTSCLGASLVNTLFVMDEPSIGLHPRDVGRLLRVMKNLRDKGNTLLVVEHEEAVLRAADNIIEVGPGRGEKGGHLVFNGTVEHLLGSACAPQAGGDAPPPRTSPGRIFDEGAENSTRGARAPRSLTADYLTGRKSIPLPSTRRSPSAWLKVSGASEHNLQNIDVDFPLGVFCCITGVSGSGKSTLIHDVLYRNLQSDRGIAPDERPGACEKISGAEHLARVMLVDQSPLSRTPRSNPALYLGVFDAIRELFAMLPEARAQGLTASAFSFNSGPGRCARCCGTGFEKIEMQFLSDLFIRCPECEGARYQPHILKIKVRGKSIADVLDLTITEATGFFAADRSLKSKLGNIKLLEEVGLGYLKLGQPLNVLSGGESQRLKLVRRLSDGTETNSLLIFDEPTTGLHFDDIALLLKVFQRLVEQGNSLVVIEHNLEVIRCADYIIDLGPEAGGEGGLVVAAGTPEEVAGCEASHTGRSLKSRSAGVSPADCGVPPQSSSGVYEAEEVGAARVAENPSGGTPDGTGETPALRLPALNGNSIEIHGAREHNLKNLTVSIPRDQMVVITGLSGSGKSTLAFDILFAEGQRRFLDSMSPYARQFVQQLEKPDVDVISGLPPTVAIEQRVTRGSGKSTVATVTEVYHFLRLLFAKLGTQFCPDCHLPVEKQTAAAITKRAEALAAKGRIKILAPIIKARKGFHTDVASNLGRQGFTALFVDGNVVPIGDFQKLDRFKEHSIDVIVGEVGRKSDQLPEIIQRALELGHGTIHVLDVKRRSTILSTEMSCPGCGRSFEELDPRMFSFNSPHGWCETCHGFGEVSEEVSVEEQNTVLETEIEEEKQYEWLTDEQKQTCPDCDGARLNTNARAVELRGQRLGAVASLSASAVHRWASKLKFSAREKFIAADIIPEITQRLEFMEKVGLDYLALGRSSKTLSGGESQRIRLAAQLGSNLRGVLYVLDEPTIGLHPRDNQALLDTLDALKRKGNSLVIVEHDDDTMRRADLIIDLGPGAGLHGGEVVAVGRLDEIKRNPLSTTGRCLTTNSCAPARRPRRPLDSFWLELNGATANNLKNIDVRFPIGRFSVITGISGSGKSTLLHDVLLPAVRESLGKSRAPKIPGAEFIETVYEVDQTPIGKTSRSTPATYIKVFDEIRKQFGSLPVSRMRGYSPSRFSFNCEGGRCEACAGQGVIKIEMNFLPPSYLPCDDCRGKRYNAQTLEVTYNEKSIGDVMEMTIEQAAEFFKSNPKIHLPLSLLVDTGLGYLTLGQPSPTLSGGEAQRLKLVSELTRGVTRARNDVIRRQRKPQSTLYLLEEPTIGLHMADVEQLLKVLHRLVDEGNTVIVIEHNLQLISAADYLVDMGPEAGELGGRVVASGTPEQVAKSRTSRTAPFLRKVLSE